MKRATALQLTSRDIERFWTKVDMTPGLGPKGVCWEWTAGTLSGGYGAFWLPGRHMARAHRVAWTIVHGPIPHGQCVLHECDNPPCIRCLFLGTLADNVADMRSKGRARGGTKRLGELHWNHRLAVADVLAIRASAESQRALARRYGVDRRTISAVLTHATWRHV
jgi:hypothetical protein